MTNFELPAQLILMAMLKGRKSTHPTRVYSWQKLQSKATMPKAIIDGGIAALLDAGYIKQYGSEDERYYILDEWQADKLEYGDTLYGRGADNA